MNLQPLHVDFHAAARAEFGERRQHEHPPAAVARPCPGTMT
jgi:hypothetical protein